MRLVVPAPAIAMSSRINEPLGSPGSTATTFFANAAGMTTIALPSAPQPVSASVLAIAPIALIVFTAFFVIGMALPVLPLHVHESLGMGAFVVGIVAGAQFTAALVSRLR